MKKQITLILLLFLSLTAYSQTKISVRNTDSQKIVREGDSLKLDNSPGIDLSDLKGSTLKKTSRDSIANLTQAQLIALGTRFVTDTVADVVSGGGTVVTSAIPLGFVSPRAYGAVMDGVTDDRDALVAALAANDKIWIDSDMYLDCSAIATDVIYIDDNKTILGDGNVKLTVLNQYSPVFHIALSENVHFEGFTMEWIGEYDAGNYRMPSTVTSANQQGLEDWLVANKGMTFNSANPLFNGDSIFRSMFLVDGAQNLTIKNVEIKAKDDAGAHQFIPWICRIKSQFDKNSTVNNESTASRTMSTNLHFENVTIDGALMGIQGDAKDVTILNLIGKRYSDAQSANGSFIGGNTGDNTYNVAPPHLIYFIPNQYGDRPKNIKIINTIDYGIYVGSPNVRATSSGYCMSLVFNQDNEDIFVDGYKSFRRDGFAGIVNITNGTFKNIYSESYNSELFSGINNDFSNMRLNGNLNNVVLSNITLKDLSTTGEIPPITTQFGDKVLVNNVNLYSKELTNIPRNFLSFYGSNNKVINSGLNIENFNTTNTFVSAISQLPDTRNNAENNYYDIYVKGWRALTSNEAESMIRSDLLVSPINTNPNYYKITDVDNNYYLESDAGITKIVWTLSTLMTVGTGTNSRFSIDAYDDWLVKKIKLQTISSLGTGTTYSLGTGSAAQTAWLPTFNATAGSLISRNINEVTPEPSSNRPLFLFSDAAMNGTGQIKLTMELEKYQEGNNVTILND